MGSQDWGNPAAGQGGGRDGGCPAIVARRNWVAAWSEASLADLQAKGDGEMAIRSGINLVIYAFTGQYKADQVHMPTIMQRLGQQFPCP
jgi:hypothetical protein